MSELDAAIDAIAAAEGALARAAGSFPEVGACPIRAVIDVERGNLKASRRHILAARTAARSAAMSNPDVEDLVRRLRAPAYWMSGSSEGHEGDNDAPREAADMLEALARGEGM